MGNRTFLIIAVLFLSAATLYIRTDSALAGAQPSTAGAVTITDSAISPTSVSILAGGSVLWTNHGRRPHSIVSSRGGFDAFWLASAHSHRVSFPLPGVYPYTVDAMTKGIVLVFASSARVPPSAGGNASSPGPVTSGPENCGHPKIYHYDIDVTVHRDEAYTFTPWHTPGTVTRVLDWHAKWSHASMSVERCSGVVRVLIPAGIDTSDARKEGLAAGESSVKIDWNDKSELYTGPPQDPSSLVPLCHFTDLSGSPAKLALHGKLLANGAGTEFLFYSVRINPQAYLDMVDKNCDHRRATSGPGVSALELSSTFSPFRIIDGLDWSLTDESLNLYASSSRAAAPFPMNALAYGKGFDFRTGPLQTEIRNPRTSNAVSDWATVSFTPVH